MPTSLCHKITQILFFHARPQARAQFLSHSLCRIVFVASCFLLALLVRFVSSRARDESLATPTRRDADCDATTRDRAGGDATTPPRDTRGPHSRAGQEEGKDAIVGAWCVVWGAVVVSRVAAVCCACPSSSPMRQTRPVDSPLSSAHARISLLTGESSHRRCHDRRHRNTDSAIPPPLPRALRP